MYIIPKTSRAQPGEARLEIGTLKRVSIYKDRISQAPEKGHLIPEGCKHYVNPYRTNPNKSEIFISVSKFLSGDVEAVAIKLASGEVFKGSGRGRKNNKKSEMHDADLKRSQRRARTNVRRACLNYLPDRMLTLTFRENLTDLKQAWTIFKSFNARMKRRYGDRWRYVIVPEFQKRGAVHFHLAIDGYYSVKVVRAIWSKCTGSLEGNIDITSPRKALNKKSWNPKRIANYLSKYITKLDSVGFNSRRYAKGGDIPEPEKFTGYVSLGKSCLYILQNIFDELTTKPISGQFHENKGREIAYLTT